MLDELFNRLLLYSQDSILVSYDDVRKWPESDFRILVESSLLKPAKPATSLVCNGCEENCLMPVFVFPGSERAFIACDRRHDTSRINVQLNQLQQWQLSSNAVYKLLSEQSGLTSTWLQTLPIVWNRALLFDDQGLKIDSNYLLELSAKLQPAGHISSNCMKLVSDYWSITFSQKTVTVKNSKGIRYIEYLIRNKRNEVHVLDLFYAIDPPDIYKIDQTLSGMSGAELEMTDLSIANLKGANMVMTPESKRILQNHLKALTEKIEDALERGDEDLQCRLEYEQDKILEQLNKDFGLAGKPRESDSLTEQLRKNITNCINKDKKKLQKSFPEFVSHLVFIQTGTFCSYAPNPDIEWK